jgi:hypothetical protein
MNRERGQGQEAVGKLIAHYRSKARAVSRAAVAIGAAIGAGVGSVPLSPLRAAWPIPSSFGFATILGGLVVGVLIGYVIGDGRAQLYRHMAEQARLQLELDERVSETDARIAQLLAALTARAAATARAQAPQPVASPPTSAAPPLSYPQLRTVDAGGALAAPPLSPPVSGQMR